MTLVKICGLARPQDVRAAVAAHAWACGFVLTRSPRRIEPELARRLRTQAGRTLTVAVVGDEPAADVANLLAASGLDAVQLSAGAAGCGVRDLRLAVAERGVADVPDVAGRAAAGRPVIIAAADTPDALEADFLLYDSRSQDAYGGTGRPLDWTALADPPARPRGRCLMALAGGLDETNVGEAIRLVRPHVVDVSGGVESSPGVKDAARIDRFMAAVRAADECLTVRDARRTRPRRPRSDHPSRPPARSGGRYDG